MPVSSCCFNSLFLLYNSLFSYSIFPPVLLLTSNRGQPRRDILFIWLANVYGYICAYLASKCVTIYVTYIYVHVNFVRVYGCVLCERPHVCISIYYYIILYSKSLFQNKYRYKNILYALSQSLPNIQKLILLNCLLACLLYMHIFIYIF